MYYSTEVLVDILAGLCDLVPNYRIKAPLLSWDYKQQGVDKAIELLIAKGYHAERFEGEYYDCYAEGDCDLCIICGKKAGAPILYGWVNYISYTPERPIKIGRRSPRFKLEKGSSGMFGCYDEGTQYEMYDLMYGKGNYTWVVRDQILTDHEDGNGYTICFHEYEVPRP